MPLRRLDSAANLMSQSPSFELLSKACPEPSTDALDFASDLYQLASQDPEDLHSSWRVFTSMGKHGDSNDEGALTTLTKFVLDEPMWRPEPQLSVMKGCASRKAVYGRWLRDPSTTPP